MTQLGARPRHHKAQPGATAVRCRGSLASACEQGLQCLLRGVGLARVSPRPVVRGRDRWPRWPQDMAKACGPNGDLRRTARAPTSIEARPWPACRRRRAACALRRRPRDAGMGDRDETILEPGNEDDPPLETLCAVKGHDVDGVADLPRRIGTQARLEPGDESGCARVRVVPEVLNCRARASSTRSSSTGAISPTSLPSPTGCRSSRSRRPRLPQAARMPSQPALRARPGMPR